MGNTREKISRLEDQEFQRKAKKQREYYKRNNLRDFPRTEGYELPVQRIHPMLSTMNNFLKDPSPRHTVKFQNTFQKSWDKENTFSREKKVHTQRIEWHQNFQ